MLTVEMARLAKENRLDVFVPDGTAGEVVQYDAEFAEVHTRQGTEEYPLADLEPSQTLREAVGEGSSEL
ncbi:MAG TPA: hypothetical protein VKB59_12565 [Micromonosporaceae bacterium]|nr:hypothetical protein [Micromonosporaceae bacterium]